MGPETEQIRQNNCTDQVVLFTLVLKNTVDIVTIDQECSECVDIVEQCRKGASILNSANINTRVDYLVFLKYRQFQDLK